MFNTKNVAIAAGVGLVGGAAAFGLYKLRKNKKEKEAARLAEMDKMMNNAVNEMNLTGGKGILTKTNEERGEMEYYFDAMWENTPVDEEYNPDWANGTGYFNHAVTEVRPEGSIVRCIDEHGRKIILAGYRGRSTHVFFERYNRKEGLPFTLIHQRIVEGGSGVISDSIDLEQFKTAIDALTGRNSK